MVRKSYRVTIERDAAGFWVAEISNVAACYAQGRSLAAAKRKIREVLGFVLENEKAAEKADLSFDYEGLPKALRVALERNDALQAAVETAKKAAEIQRVKTIKVLDKADMSRRDVAELVGLSHQRVDQILKD